MQIGCQNYTHEVWFTFDDDAICEMDGEDDAAERWNQWKPLLKQMCEMIAARRPEEAEKPEEAKT